MTENLRIVSTETDENGDKFVNMYEGIKYPIFGTQFHPEKGSASMFKFRDFEHTNSAQQLNRYIADFFVQEAKKNTNKFPTYAEEVAALIGNYEKLETTSYYGGLYLFD